MTDGTQLPENPETTEASNDLLATQLVQQRTPHPHRREPAERDPPRLVERPRRRHQRRIPRRRQIIAHRNSMFAAFIVSSVFLVAYIANHILHGDMLFPKAYPTARFIYLWILLTPHILLAIVCLPMILITFFLSLTGRFPAHRRLARWTYPIWLYVSVSGVIVYAMLAAYR